jgi:hypothetical protein
VAGRPMPERPAREVVTPVPSMPGGPKSVVVIMAAAIVYSRPVVPHVGVSAEPAKADPATNSADAAMCDGVIVHEDTREKQNCGSG